MSTFGVILPAAGKSERFRDQHYKKPFAPLADRAVWLHTVEKFVNRVDVKQLIVVISPEDRSLFDAKFSANVVILGIDVVEGGGIRSGGHAAASQFRAPTIPWRVLSSRLNFQESLDCDAYRYCPSN